MSPLVPLYQNVGPVIEDLAQQACSHALGALKKLLIEETGAEYITLAWKGECLNLVEAIMSFDGSWAKDLATTVYKAFCANF
jgi:hypothetical protein